MPGRVSIVYGGFHVWPNSSVGNIVHASAISLSLICCRLSHHSKFRSSAIAEQRRRAIPKSISGKALVVDGDTLIVDGKHIRLFGIDAPEIRHLQRCLDKEDQRYHCGIHSGLALEKIIIGRDVTCNWTRRHFDRLVAVCHVAGSGDGATAQIEINAEMVRSGWAVDCPLYSRSKHNSLGKYAAEEAEAKREKRGLWSGKFYRAEFCKDFI